MNGNTFTRVANVLRYMLIRPSEAKKWISNRFDQKTPFQSQLPWISYSSINFLEKRIRIGASVFEYGGGGSTLYFLNKGCSVTTAENSREWAEIYSNDLSTSKKFNLQIVEMRERPDKQVEIPLLKKYISLINVNSPYDIIMVDGVDGDLNGRVECVREAKNHLKNGGLIILDDSWRAEYDEVLTILKGFKRYEFWGLGPSRLGVTKTDIYQKI